MNPYLTDTNEYIYTTPIPPEKNTDFSRFIRGNATGLIENCKENALEKCLSVASNEHRLSYRGPGYSCGGIAVAKNGSLFDNMSLTTSPLLNLDVENRRVTIPTSVTWGEVESELQKRKFRVPVLPDFMKLSVGGTLSVGGIGVDSIRNGFQADLIRNAVVYLPGKGKVICNATQEKELFEYSAGATGNSGLIHNVTIRVEPAHKAVRVFKKHVTGLKDLSTFLTNPDFYLNPGMEHFQAWYSNGEAVCEAGDYITFQETKPVPEFFRSGWSDMEIIEPPYPFSLSRRREKWINGFRDPAQIWSDYFFTPENFHRFMSYLDEIRNNDSRFNSIKAIYILIIKRPENPHPSPFLPGQAGSILFSAGLYSMAHRMDPLEISTCLEIMTEISHKALELGGRSYQYGFPGPGHTKDHTLFHKSAFSSLQDFRMKNGLTSTGFL